MNFRDLYDRLGVLEADATKIQVSGDPAKEPQPVAPQDVQDKGIPGAQPSLGPKPTMVAPAVPYGQRAPTPQAVQDPKADIAAMSKALQVMAMQNKQAQPNVGMQGVPTSAEKAMPIGSQAKQSIGRPGEPLEEKSEPTGDKGRWAIDRFVRRGATIDNWIADIKKDPKAYYSITDPEEREKVKAILNKGDEDLIKRVKAADPKAPAPVTTPPAEDLSLIHI